MNLRASLQVINRLGRPFTAQEMVDKSFRAAFGGEKPYGTSRFGDGTIPVYYSALDELTCQRELKFHTERNLSEQSEHLARHNRFFSLIGCEFQGTAADLLGHEVRYPELISRSEDGYPFCREIGMEAVRKDIQGLLAPSARNRGGTCVPVFARSALSRPKVLKRFALKAGSDGPEFHEE